MKKIYSLFLISLLVFSCENEKEIISIELTNDIVPIPKEINFNDKNKGLAFSKSISVFYKNSEISPLIQLFKKVNASSRVDFKLRKSPKRTSLIV